MGVTNITSSPSLRNESEWPNSPLIPTIISCFSLSIPNVWITVATSARSGNSISKGSGLLPRYTLRSLYSLTVTFKV